MWHAHEGMAWWMIFGGAFWLLFWASIVYLFARSFVQREHHHHDDSSDALEIARRRLASGAITPEQFEEIAGYLSATLPRPEG